MSISKHKKAGTSEKDMTTFASMISYLKKKKNVFICLAVACGVFIVSREIFHCNAMTLDAALAQLFQEIWDPSS